MPRTLPGLLAVAALAAAAEALAPRAGIPSVVVAIALGALAGNALPASARAALRPGLELTTKRVLKVAIVLLGLRFTAEKARDLGGPVLGLIAGCLVLSLLVAAALGRPFGVSRRASVLLGCGTAICGATAVVTVAPLLRADDDEVAFSIATIFLFNVAALFAFPPLGHALGMSDLAFGAWVGTAVNDTSACVATGGAYSPAAADYATAIKLIRTLALVPLALGVALAASRATGAREGEPRNVDVGAIFPWFVVGFAAAALLANLVELPAAPLRWTLLAAQVAITGVLAAVGLNLDARKALGAGTRSLGLGFAIAGVMAVASLGVARLLGVR
jgi:uncharacterized integral membrane protein (TIGR00698 family)